MLLDFQASRLSILRLLFYPTFLFQFESKPSPNQLLLQQQQFQQQMANEAESNSNASSLVTNNPTRPDSVSVASPGPVTQTSTTPSANNFGLHLKLSAEQHQYPFAAVAAALHNQIGQPTSNASSNMNNYHRDETQSESERSTPFIQPQQNAHQQLPYHMHHSLIQHLSDMRDLYGGHIANQTVNHHN